MTKTNTPPPSPPTGDEAIELLLDTLAEVIDQACTHEGELDSMALTAYADGMRVLERFGRLQIIDEYGRRVIGMWPEDPAE